LETRKKYLRIPSTS